MPDFPGPHLSTPEKPDVDPAVKAVVDISKGRHAHPHNATPPLAPGWGSSAVVVQLHGANAAADPAGICTPPTRAACTPRALHLALPKRVEETGGSCLSPGAHASGQLTYGVYEGGGVIPKISPAKDVGIDDGGVGLVEPGTAEALAGQRRVDDNCGGGAATEKGGRVGGAGEFGGSTMPVVSTPRHPLNVPRGVSTPGGSGVSARTPRAGTEREEELRRRREATAKHDAEMEVALWIEGVSGVTFPGRFWSSLKDGGEEAVVVLILLILYTVV